AAYTAAPIAAAKLTPGKLNAPAGEQTLAFKGRMTVPVVPAIDPLTSGVRVLVDGVLDSTIPGGAFDPVTRTGWKVKKKGAFTYHNGRGGILGIGKVALEVSSKTPGLVRFTVAGKTGSYAVDPAHLPRRATLILDTAAGQCGDAGFAGPPPAPVCVLRRSARRCSAGEGLRSGVQPGKSGALVERREGQRDGALRAPPERSVRG